MEHNKSPKLKKYEQMMFNKHWTITIRVFGLTIAIIALCGGIGYFIDKQLSSSPIGLGIGVIIAYPLSQIAVYKVFKKITQ